MGPGASRGVLVLLVAGGLVAACVTARVGSSAGVGTGRAGRFVQVAAGFRHACGLREDRTVVCWGDEKHGNLAVPPERFAQISAGPSTTSGVKTDGSILCWGYQGGPQGKKFVAPAGTFTKVACGVYHPISCGLRQDGSVACWGPKAFEFASASGTIRDLTVGEYNVCFLDDQGRAGCLGVEVPGRFSPPTEALTQVSLGRWVVCGVSRSGGRLLCWGYGHEPMHKGVGIAVVAPAQRKANSALADPQRQASVDAAKRARQKSLEHQLNPNAVSAGAALGSAIGAALAEVDKDRFNRWVRRDGLLAVPSGEFVQVSAGQQQLCALRKDGTVACWGKGSFEPPPGRFRQIDVGTLFFACGVREDGRIACWGEDIALMGAPFSPP